MSMIAIVNGKLADPVADTLQDGVILIDDDRIVAAGVVDIPADAQRVDAQGLVVAPGLVDTEFTRGWAPEVRNRTIEQTPLGRIALPEDIGRAVLAVAVDLPMTTGVVIPVDGGHPLGAVRRHS